MGSRREKYSEEVKRKAEAAGWTVRELGLGSNDASENLISARMLQATIMVLPGGSHAIISVTVCCLQAG